MGKGTEILFRKIERSKFLIANSEPACTVLKKGHQNVSVRIVGTPAKI
jgi:hypothetical protein